MYTVIKSDEYKSVFETYCKIQTLEIELIINYFFKKEAGFLNHSYSKITKKSVYMYRNNS